MLKVNLSIKDLISLNPVLVNKENNEKIKTLQTDSREVKKGDWFICLRGENTDGHKYISQALKNGASGIIYEKTPSNINPEGLVVNNCNLFLGEMARIKRDQINPFVLAITGSAGKSSTKEIAAFFLEHIFSKREVLKTSGNYNNQFGVPYTLLSLKPSHKFAIIEMGTNHPGEIKQLSLWAKPDISIITSISEGHIEFFNSVEDIADEKSDIICGMKKNGFLAVPNKINCLKIIEKKMLTKKIKIKKINKLSDEVKLIEISSLGTKFSYKNNEFLFPIAGEFQFYNFLLIWRVLKICFNNNDKFNQGLKKVLDNLSGLKIMQGRLQIVKHKKYNIWDDTYNANEASYEAAFQFISNIKKNNNSAGAFGSMAELGKKSEKAHEKLGKMAFKYGFSKVFFSYKIKKEGNAFYRGWISSGGKKSDICILSNNDLDIKSGVSFVKEGLKKEDHFLVKGSRSLKMERVFNYF
ncbi:MAG: UDP-N-acetylmuramoyl-tripeptide--D-alanyl-D-alanine ligase [Spirochaetia bacterium]|nr:UDP-N-acetylmuramoyl-tripeptide--D-alanyl-D-alanine ligase [Spirochaetia bacterium]